jgi:hypothetical protein
MAARRAAGEGVRVLKGNGMSKTFLGQLILRLQTEGLGEGKKVLGVMNDIERKARTLGQAGTSSWGIGFQRQLDRLKTTKSEIADVQRSWLQLHESFKTRNLAKALRSSEVSHWRVSTLSHLAQQRAAIDDHFRKIEASAKGHGARMEGITRAVMVSMGYYTAAYGGGLMIRGAMTSASDRSRVDADTYFRGLNESERNRIDAAASKTAADRRLSITDVKEILADASMNMRGGVDGALGTLDSQSSAFKLFANSPNSTPAAAIAQLRAFNKAMDNANVTDPKEYNDFLNNFTKAWQVNGRDIDAEDLAMGIKYSRSSGKVFSHDFLSRVLPFIMAETSGSDSGVQLRALFDQFVVGRAPKNALKAQRAFGLRDKDDRLVGQDEFAQNPMDWAHKYLLPAIQAKGTDVNDTTEVARIIGTLTNNRVSSDALVKFITGWDQMRNLLDNKFPNAKGLAAADEIDALAMSSAVDGFTTSLGNLSAALIPVQSVINPGLNALADGINHLAASAKDNPLATALGIGGVAAGVVGGGKIVAGKLADAFGLRTAAAELIVAAQALKGAAGTDAATDLAGGGGKKGLWSRIKGAALPIALTAAAAELARRTIEETSTSNQVQNLKPGGRRVIGGQGDAADIANRLRQNQGQYYEAGGFHRAYANGGPMPGDSIDFSGAVTKAEQAGADMTAALNITATPTIALGNLQQAVNLAQQFLSLMKQSRAAADAGVSTAMRRNMADYGVAP